MIHQMPPLIVGTKHMRETYLSKDTKEGDPEDEEDKVPYRNDNSRDTQDEWDKVDNTCDR
jgi:hypothetical protein